MTGPTVGAVSYLTSGTDTIGSVPVPSGVAADSIVLVVLYRGADGPQAYESLTLPDGSWSLATHNPGATTGTFHCFYMDVAWKRATGADSGTYDFSWASSRFRVGFALRIDDCATSGTPFEDDDGATSSSASTDTPAVSVTTTGADRLLVWAGGSWTVGAWTPPSGFTDEADTDFDLLHGASLAQASAGSSGSLVGTQGSEAHAAWAGAFTPAASGITGVLAATLPVPTASIPATVTDAAALAATLPVPTAALSAAVTDAGALAATLPAPTASIPATVTDAGVLAGVLPLPTAALAGLGPVTGALAATLPVPTAALTGDVAGGTAYPLSLGAATRLNAYAAGAATRLGVYSAGTLERT
jgi:hypothetical protein